MRNFIITICAMAGMAMTSDVQAHVGLRPHSHPVFNAGRGVVVGTARVGVGVARVGVRAGRGVVRVGCRAVFRAGRAVVRVGNALRPGIIFPKRVNGYNRVVWHRPVAWRLRSGYLFPRLHSWRFR